MVNGSKPGFKSETGLTFNTYETCVLWDEIICLNATPQKNHKDNSNYSLVRFVLQNLGIICCATLYKPVQIPLHKYLL